MMLTRPSLLTSPQRGGESAVLAADTGWGVTPGAREGESFGPRVRKEPAGICDGTAGVRLGQSSARVESAANNLVTRSPASPELRASSPSASVKTTAGSDTRCIGTQSMIGETTPARPGLKRLRHSHAAVGSGETPSGLSTTGTRKWYDTRHSMAVSVV